MTPLLPGVLLGLAVLVTTSRGPVADRLADLLPGPGAGPDPAARPARRLALPGSLPASRGGRSVPVLTAAVGGVLLGGPALATALALVVGAATASLRRRAAAAADRAERAGAVEACAVLAGELRAGRPAAVALEQAGRAATGPLRPRLLAGAAAVSFGADPGAALRAAAPGPRSCVPEVASALAACWQVCSGTGNGLAAAVERLEEGLRAAELTRAEVDAELAGPRATAALLAGLPLAGTGLGVVLGAAPVQVLLHSTLGAACLVCGVLLDLAGLAWTRRTAAAVAGGGRAA